MTRVRTAVLALGLLTACGEATYECRDAQSGALLDDGTMSCDVYRERGDQVLNVALSDCGDEGQCECAFVETCGGTTND